MPPKKKKIDHEALASPFMRIPMMKVDIARGFLDAGIKDTFELSGRAPETLRDEILNKHPSLKTIPDLIQRIRLYVYFVENPDPEPAKLKLSFWDDNY